MDRETFANVISQCGKRDFEIACRIVLQDVFNLIVVNVDGTNDGGADFTALRPDGVRLCTAYQITTQKSDIKGKAYRDAAKSIKKLNAKRFYFLCKYNLSESECREIETTISVELNIPASVYSPKLIADLMLNNKLAGKFLDRIGYSDLHRFESTNVDYREMALHSYSFLSKDARNLKSQIYDDSLLLVLSDYDDGLVKDEIVSKAIDLLSLPISKREFLQKRIDSLMGKGQILKHSLDKTRLVVSSEMKEDIRNRKSIYELELSSLSAAQVDIMNDYGINWTEIDSRQASIWIANAYMSRQLQTLESVDATLADNFYKKINRNGYALLKNYLQNEKGIPTSQVDEIADKLIIHASTHPLMIKITSASVYLALEGGNPLAACKAIGASTWHDVHMLVEPTLGIPYVCSLLYKGNVNRVFDYAILAMKQAVELGVRLTIPYYYIKECAGHLHMARKFDGLDLNAEEMQYSSNAFVSNYYALKLKGIPVPEHFIDYLATFSPAIRTEMADYNEWIRAIMTNIQSHFTRQGVKFQETPTYSQEDLKSIEMAYTYYLDKNDIKKSTQLMKNDVISLKFIDERTSKYGEHWMILTYDKTLINVSKNVDSLAWVNTPFTFLDLTEMSKEMSEKKLFSLIHSVASFSSRTLSIGARILDRIILYASDKMQDWQFLNDIKQFKQEMVDSMLLEDINFMDEVDKKTNEFLEKHGAPVNISNEQNDVDLETEAQHSVENGN